VPVDTEYRPLCVEMRLSGVASMVIVGANKENVIIRCILILLVIIDSIDVIVFLYEFSFSLELSQISITC